MPELPEVETVKEGLKDMDDSLYSGGFLYLWSGACGVKNAGVADDVSHPIEPVA